MDLLTVMHKYTRKEDGMVVYAAPVTNITEQDSKLWLSDVNAAVGVFFMPPHSWREVQKPEVGDFYVRATTGAAELVTAEDFAAGYEPKQD